MRLLLEATICDKAGRIGIPLGAITNRGACTVTLRYELVTSYGGSIGIFRSANLRDWTLFDDILQVDDARALRT